MQKKQKQFALLIDPDKHTVASLGEVISVAHKSGVHLILVGGSLLMKDNTAKTVGFIKEHTDKPVILFPGSTMQYSAEADAMLFLSLISGRNAEYLIGRHVEIAPVLKKSGLEIIPTGYILVDTGQPTTVNYMSNSFPVPYKKFDIAACTAMAGEMLGMKLIFLEGGSGASKPIHPGMISTVKEHIDIPVIVGGGLVNRQLVKQTFQAGADIVVVGNALEKNHLLVHELSEVAHELS